MTIPAPEALQTPRPEEVEQLAPVIVGNQIMINLADDAVEALEATGMAIQDGAYVAKSPTEEVDVFRNSHLAYVATLTNIVQAHE